MQPVSQIVTSAEFRTQRRRQLLVRAAAQGTAVLAPSHDHVRITAELQDSRHSEPPDTALNTSPTTKDRKKPRQDRSEDCPTPRRGS